MAVTKPKGDTSQEELPQQGEDDDMGHRQRFNYVFNDFPIISGSNVGFSKSSETANTGLAFSLVLTRALSPFILITTL